MSQPQITDLFGSTATWDSTNKKLIIPITALPVLTAQTPTSLELYAAIVSLAHIWISANTDQTVLADSTLTTNAPITKNSVARTQFQYAVRFYNAYNQPTFDPNAI